MRMKKTGFAIGLTLASTLAITACSQSSEDAMMERVATVDVEEASDHQMAEAEAAMTPPPPASIASPQDRSAAVASEPTPPSGGEVPVGSLPQIAYRYALGFRLPDEAIKPLQNRHADMCEARGVSQCRIISMRQAEREGDYSYGSLQIAVASTIARDFSKELEESSGSVNAELVSSSIDGEDLSKQIVDTEARLRSRELLRDRLMDILRSRRGTVAELVEAERGVAQVNQEIDQERSWLTEIRGRVAFSQMSITYEAGSPAAADQQGGFSEPIYNAWGALGSILGSMIAFFMIALTVLLPIGLVVYGGLRLWRWAQAYRFETAEAE
ncbi:MAG: DUF4349 domain-containing protein [Erythrobacter sp.]